MEKKEVKKVCVTGAASYLGSSLVKKLLERGYAVHATLRNLGDESKVGILKGLRSAERRLELFEADIYNGDEFGKAIEGCEIVVHMATPLQHNSNNSRTASDISRTVEGFLTKIRDCYIYKIPPSWILTTEDYIRQVFKYKDTSEAAVAGVKSIVGCCIRTGTVKKLIYTASVVAASPLKEEEDGRTSFKESMDESCWTPLNLSYSFTNDMLMGYVHSKTLAEKEVLSYNGDNTINVVSLVCGLVGGDTLLSSMSESNGCIVSQLTNDNRRYQTLRFLEELIGKLPIVHIEDISEAHIFCMENSTISGRFLCANAYISSAEIASYYQNLHPDLHIDEKMKEDMKREIYWGSTKLRDMGFEYKYDTKMILDESLKCAKKMNEFI